jgi:hypothetical protein
MLKYPQIWKKNSKTLPTIKTLSYFNLCATQTQKAPNWTDVVDVFCCNINKVDVVNLLL